MSRGGAIIGVEKGFAALIGTIFTWSTIQLARFTAETEKAVEDTGFFKFAYLNTIDAIKMMYKIIVNFPNYLKIFLQNLLVFVYIFCLLVVIGRFDWLLNDLYALVALSAVLTYISYR